MMKVIKILKDDEILKSDFFPHQLSKVLKRPVTPQKGLRHSLKYCFALTPVLLDFILLAGILS